LEKVALRETSVEKVGSKRGWCWKKWHYERLVLETLALREAGFGKGGTNRG